MLFFGLGLLTLTGCSALTSAVAPAVLGGLAKGDPMVGVDTEIVAGDKDQSVVLGETIDAAQKFDEIELEDNSQLTISSTTEQGKRAITAETLEYEEGLPYWQAALGSITFLLLGMFMPQFIIRKKDG